MYSTGRYWTYKYKGLVRSYVQLNYNIHILYLYRFQFLCAIDYMVVYTNYREIQWNLKLI